MELLLLAFLFKQDNALPYFVDVIKIVIKNARNIDIEAKINISSIIMCCIKNCDINAETNPLKL